MSIPKKEFKFMYYAMLADQLVIAGSFVLAYLTRFKLTPYAGTPPAFSDYAVALIVILPVFLYLFKQCGLYSNARHIRRIEEIFLVLKAVSYSIVVLMALTFIYRRFSYSRIFLVILWVYSIIAVSTIRYFLIQWEYHRKRLKKSLQRVLLVGVNRNTRKIIKWAKDNPHYGRDVVGVLTREPEMIGKHVEGVTVLGSTDQTESFMDHLQPNEVILLDQQLTKERITDLVVTCEDKLIDFKIGADFYGLMTQNVDVEYISSVPLLGFSHLPLDDPWNRFVKRTFDILVSGTLLFLMLPIVLTVIFFVKVGDRGPILFRQKRMGRDGRIFNVLKFRTMKVDAEKETGPVWAQANDSRRTFAGNFLRRTNLDELPQLWNVLRGNMSLVGPRPERPHFVDQFRESIPRYMSRHKVKSGITGWAQVNGYRGNTSIQERIKYDLYYMENWSLLFDIEILFMTFFAFKNAY